MKADNDNEPLSFITLGLAAKRVVEKLSAGKLPVDFSCSGDIGGMGRLRTIKSTQGALPTISPDSGNPLPSRIRASADTLEANSIANRDSLIRLVLQMSSLAEISEPVIERVAVGMVNETVRPNSMNIEPGETVSTITATINLDSDGSAIATTSDVTNSILLPGAGDAPSKKASLRTIEKLLAEFFSGNHASELHKKEDEQSKRDPAPGGTDEQKRGDEREYIEHRLREIRAWERRISGKKN